MISKQKKQIFAKCEKTIDNTTYCDIIDNERRIRKENDIKRLQEDEKINTKRNG